MDDNCYDLIDILAENGNELETDMVITTNGSR